MEDPGVRPSVPPANAPASPARPPAICCGGVLIWAPADGSCAPSDTPPERPPAPPWGSPCPPISAEPHVVAPGCSSVLGAPPAGRCRVSRPLGAPGGEAAKPSRSSSGDSVEKRGARASGGWRVQLQGFFECIRRGLSRSLPARASRRRFTLATALNCSWGRGLRCGSRRGRGRARARRPRRFQVRVAAGAQAAGRRRRSAGARRQLRRGGPGAEQTASRLRDRI